MIKKSDIIKTSASILLNKDMTNISIKKIDDELQLTQKKVLTNWINSDYKDMSFYSSKEYAYNMIIGLIYNTGYAVSTTIKYLRENININNLTIADDYNGLGITTIMLQDNFPNTDIAYFNTNNWQSNFYLKLCNKYNIKPARRITKEPVDIMISYETLEHYQKPFEYLDILLNNTKKYLILSTCFSTLHTGHFPYYFDKEGNKISNKRTTKEIKKYIKKNFNIIFTGYNAWPVIYKRKVKEEIKK